MDENVRRMVGNIHWLGHDSFKITGSKTVYIDPWKLSGGQDGDLVLVTHDHYDHCSPDDIRKVLGPDGKVMTAECCRSQYPDADYYTLPWMFHNNVNGIKIYATAAYNIDKQFHLKEYGHVGYVIYLDGVRIYHAGDCDAFPHMRDIECDIALLPVSGTYVMNVAEAIDAVNMLKPQLAIPMHYGDIVGSKEDAETFQKLAPCEVVILDSER
ncbi:MAG: MBL fold metallo-hydrolase [Candidatus Electryoneaceae bacterium]|nr:MBL fold metallo-hydrolase [Candidatus Electryoneaceae bacterium]